MNFRKSGPLSLHIRSGMPCRNLCYMTLRKYVNFKHNFSTFRHTGNIFGTKKFLVIFDGTLKFSDFFKIVRKPIFENFCPSGGMPQTKFFSCFRLYVGPFRPTNFSRHALRPIHELFGFKHAK